MKTERPSTLLTRREYLALVRHIHLDIEHGADGTFNKYDHKAKARVFDEREAEIVEKALRKIRKRLLFIERRS